MAVSQGQGYESTDHDVSGNKNAKLDDYLMRKLLTEENLNLL